MRALILMLLFPVAIYSQINSKTIVVGGITTVGNADSLGGKPPAYYVDTFSNQSIAGTKTFTDDITVDGTINYAADAQGNDDYEVNIPGITSLVEGLVVLFKANTQNSFSATLEITGVGGAKTIKKLHDQNLSSGDIEAGQIVLVVFDGTFWQMISGTPENG